MRHGTRAGLLNVAGTQVGVAVMIAIVGIGLTSMIGGDGPLVRMGAAARRGLPDLDGLCRCSGRAASSRRRGAPPAPRGGFFLQGLLVAVSNPKTLIFFGAFFPQFIDPPGNYPLQIVVMGVTAMALAAVSDCDLCGARGPRRPRRCRPAAVRLAVALSAAAS